MKLSNHYIRLRFTSVFICLSIISHGQIDCSVWLTEECRKFLLEFAQQVLDNGNCQQWEGRCDWFGKIHRKGPVSIGTNQAVEGFNLVVADGIIARELKICKDPGWWCDYVFDDNYPLMPLHEVKSFIEGQGHLPKTPSAEEIEKEGGFYLGEIALNHQEKIEEVFLHLIALKKEADELQAKLLVLRQENERLKALQSESIGN